MSGTKYWWKFSHWCTWRGMWNKSFENKGDVQQIWWSWLDDCFHSFLLFYY